MLDNDKNSNGSKADFMKKFSERTILQEPSIIKNIDGELKLFNAKISENQNVS